MSASDSHHGGAIGRRTLLQALGLAGLGTIVATRLSRPAYAAPTTGVSTRIEGFDGAEVSAVTGPLSLADVAFDSRLGIGLVVSGAQASGGRLQLVQGLVDVRVTSSGGAGLPGLKDMAADEAVSHGLHRLIGGLHGPDSKDVFGFSAVASRPLAAVADAEVHWRARVRAGTTRGAVQKYLADYHAIVLGDLAIDGTFGDFVSYTRIRQIG